MAKDKLAISTCRKCGGIIKHLKSEKPVCTRCVETYQFTPDYGTEAQRDLIIEKNERIKELEGALRECIDDMSKFTEFHEDVIKYTDMLEGNE